MAGRRAEVDTGNDSGVVLRWLIKVVFLIAIAGGLTVESAGVLLARYNAEGGASTAAARAASGIRSGGTGGDPEELARDGAGQHGCTLLSMSLNPATRTVSVTVEKKARTFFVHKFRPLRGLTLARASEDASYEAR